MDFLRYQTLSTMPPLGGYILWIKPLALLIFVLPWMWAAPWVQRDLGRFHGVGRHWALIVLGAGVLGVLLWLVVPFYLAGMGLYLVLTGGVVGAYVAWRNARVAPEEKVWTAAHLQAVVQRKPREKTAVKPLQRVNLYDTAERLVTPDQKDTATVAAFNTVQELVADMIAGHASQAEMVVSAKAAVIRLVVDGQVVDRSALALSPHDGDAAIQYLKSISGMNVEDRRRPQEGAISADLGGKRVDLRLASAGTTGGQRMQLAVVQEMVRTNLEELGMSQPVLERVIAFTRSDHGLLIVSGRSGSGVTSTMYSLLRRYDAFLHQLVTMEANPVIDLENVAQNRYGDPSEMPDRLAAALRLGANVLMVDRCTDDRGAELIRKAAADMPTVLGMHASNSFVALAKWVKLCGGAEPALKDLQIVLCQLLARRLCPDCRESYRPDPQLLAKANLAGLKVERFYRAPAHARMDEEGRPIVCPTCGGSGYFGRVGTFEMLELNDEIRQLVITGAPLAQIKAACRKNKMLYLQEQALRKVVEGVTCVKEVIRVTQESKKDG